MRSDSLGIFFPAVWHQHRATEHVLHMGERHLSITVKRGNDRMNREDTVLFISADYPSISADRLAERGLHK